MEYFFSKTLMINQASSNSLIENKINLPSFVQSVNNNLAKIPISIANSVLGSKQNLYIIVESEGWFLPKLKSKAISNAYLFEVLLGNVHRVKSNPITPPPPEKIRWKKIDLVTFIDDECLQGQKKLGFTQTKLPYRRFLLTLLYYYKKDHKVFLGAAFSSEASVEIPIS